MSPCSSGLATLQPDRCRSSRACGATCRREHVARDPREGRHAGPCMSLDELVKGDMAACICRFTHVSRATCIVDNVALHPRAERHARLSMSLHPLVWSDMNDLASRRPRKEGAAPNVTTRTRPNLTGKLSRAEPAAPRA